MYLTSCLFSILFRKLLNVFVHFARAVKLIAHVVVGHRSGLFQLPINVVLQSRIQRSPKRDLFALFNISEDRLKNLKLYG